MTADAAEQVRPSGTHARPSLLVALLAAAQFMLIVDVTVVQVSLPTIATDLGLGRDAMTWVVTGYTVAFGGLMVLGGRLADALGPRRVLGLFPRHRRARARVDGARELPAGR